MAYLGHKPKCGRTVLRPNEVEENEEDTAEGIKSLQLMTESLRSKIALKERYNKALMDELQESKAGASQMVKGLIVGNEELRNEKQEALVADVAAGNKAIRSIREIQLALGGRKPNEMLDWLEDQLFDMRKKIDRGTYKLSEIKYQLGECEKIVVELEKSPICGSSPWEIAAEQRMIHLCVKIAERDTMRDAAKILNSKYKEVLTSLRDQKGRWPLEVKQVQVLVDKFKVERVHLENMLTDAIRLRDLAKYRCEVTQEEFVNNRRARKRQLTGMKRQVEIALAMNMAKYAKTPTKAKIRQNIIMDSSVPVLNTEPEVKPLEYLRQKQAEVSAYEAKARTLVEAMHVPDMRHCPKRLAKLWSVRDELFEAAQFKYYLREVLTKQKANLALIMCHMKYTGGLEEEDYNNQLKEIQDVMTEARLRQKQNEKKFQVLEDQAVDWEMAVVGIDDLLNQGKIRTKHGDHEDILESMKLINVKLKNLLSEMKTIRDVLPTGQQDDDLYRPYVKITIPKNACRLSSGIHEAEDDGQDDDDEDEFHMSNIDVPTAADIKAKSRRIAKQGKMRRGIKDP